MTTLKTSIKLIETYEAQGRTAGSIKTNTGMEIKNCSTTEMKVIVNALSAADKSVRFTIGF